MGWLDEDPGAITCVSFAATGSPVIKIKQNLQSLLDDPMRFAAFDVYNKPYAAGFMLKLGVIKSLFGRRFAPPRLSRICLQFCFLGHFLESRISTPKFNLNFNSFYRKACG